MTATTQTPDPIGVRVAELLAEAPPITDAQRQESVRLLSRPASRKSATNPERAA